MRMYMHRQALAARPGPDPQLHGSAPTGRGPTAAHEQRPARRPAHSRFADQCGALRMSHFFRAPMACRPMGTIRVLLPLPITRTVRSFRSRRTNPIPRVRSIEGPRNKTIPSSPCRARTGNHRLESRAAAPFDRHPRSPAIASWFSAPAHPARDCPQRRLRASDSRRTSAPPTGAAGCCAARCRRHARRRQRREHCELFSGVPAKPHGCGVAKRGEREQIVPIGGHRMAAHAPLAAQDATRNSLDPFARAASTVDRSAHQRVGHELADAQQEFRAHARMEAFRVARADGQYAERALLPQRA